MTDYTLDDAFGGIDWLSQQPDAFTTGTANNVALTSIAGAMLATLQRAEAVAEAAIAAAALTSPATVNAAVNAAGDAATCHASVVELTNLQTVLNRP